MLTAIITAVIAFIGVVTSVVASLVVSIRQTDIEVQKLRTEIQQTYTGKLLEKRLEVYPALYRLLSDFDKTIRLDIVSQSTIEDLRKQIFAWDSENALIMSGYAGRMLYEFRRILIDLAQLPDAVLQSRFSSPEEKWNMLQEVGKVELALKSDIGIYVVEFSDDEKRNFSSYQEVADTLEKKSIRRNRK
jgi:hypothetical protein